MLSIVPKTEEKVTDGWKLKKGRANKQKPKLKRMQKYIGEAKKKLETNNCVAFNVQICMVCARSVCNTLNNTMRKYMKNTNNIFEIGGKQRQPKNKTQTQN